MCRTTKFAGAFCYNVSKSCAALSCRALLEVATCVAERYPSLRIFCETNARVTRLPYPFSQRSHVGKLRQTLQGKGVIHKRVETAGVYPLVPPPGRRTPAEVQRKTSRPSGANTLTQFASPRSPGAEKNCLRGSHPPVTQCRENEKGTAHAVPLPSVDMSAAQQQQLPQLPQPPQVLSPQVPQEPHPPLP